MLNSFLNKQKNILINKKLILAISGGVDSIVLLDLLSNLSLNIKIHLVYINYNVHKNTENSCKLIKSLSEKYLCSFSIYNQKISLINFENNARNVRYNILNDELLRLPILVIMTI